MLQMPMKRGFAAVKNEIKLLRQSLNCLEKGNISDRRAVEVQRAIIETCKSHLLHIKNRPSTSFKDSSVNAVIRLQPENVENFMLKQVQQVNLLKTHNDFDEQVVRDLLTRPELNHKLLDSVLSMSPTSNTLKVCINLLLYKYKDLELLFETIEKSDEILKKGSLDRLKKKVLFDATGFGLINFLLVFFVPVSSLLLADVYLVNFMLLKNLYTTNPSDVHWRPGVSFTRKLLYSDKLKLLDKVSLISRECFYPNVNNFDIKNSPLLRSFTQNSPPEATETLLARKLRDNDMIIGPSVTEIMYHDYWQSDGEFEWVEHDKDPIHFLEI